MGFSTQFLKAVVEETSDYQLELLAGMLIREQKRRALQQKTFIEGYSVSERVIDLIERGEYVPAVKQVRDEAGYDPVTHNCRLGLKEAKDIVDVARERIQKAKLLISQDSATKN